MTEPTQEEIRRVRILSRQMAEIPRELRTDVDWVRYVALAFADYREYLRKEWEREHSNRN